MTYLESMGVNSINLALDIGFTSVGDRFNRFLSCFGSFLSRGLMFQPLNPVLLLGFLCDGGTVHSSATLRPEP